MENIIEGVVDDFRVSVDLNLIKLTISRILYDGSILYVTSSEFPNLRMLSDDLACQIGVGPAEEFFKKNNVPSSSPLFSLNRHINTSSRILEVDDKEAC